ncbi:hypothetical protein ABTM15_19970, partial [Acinetobacter baumannii]
MVIILCSALAAGCFSRGDVNHSTAWYDRMRGKIALDHGIRLKTALLDRPVGDRYVNRELWETAKRPLTHEQTTLFARNGMR